MGIIYMEQTSSAVRDEQGQVTGSPLVWVDFAPVIDGANLELPAHTIFTGAGSFDLPAETLAIAEGHLYLDGDGEYHWIARPLLVDTQPKAIEGIGAIRLLWIEGEAVYVLRSVE